MSAPVDIEAARLTVSQAIARANRALDEIGDLDGPAYAGVDGTAMECMRAARSRLISAAAFAGQQYDALVKGDR